MPRIVHIHPTAHPINSRVLNQIEAIEARLDKIERDVRKIEAAQKKHLTIKRGIFASRIVISLDDHPVIVQDFDRPAEVDAILQAWSEQKEMPDIFE